MRYFAVATGMLLTAMLSAGCVPTGAQRFCLDDGDCGGGECARTNECAPEGSLIAARISWTVQGLPATAETCVPISRLSVTFEDFETGDDTIYEPVPCELTSIYFNRMPPRFDGLRIAAHGPGDGVLWLARFPLPDKETVIEVALSP